ncbi:MAG: hypothetical protein EPO09_09800, partial [Aquabacterium sp.]|uniref:hypothetical protein n=1 Tax=Aquabacterium sp. TaxID=1872578 RepID=UPI001224DCD9
MTAIARNFFETRNMAIQPQLWRWAPQDSAEVCWQAWARETAVWLTEQGADPRDALIVLPVGALLSQARQAWVSAVGGWLPRIDTIAAVSEGPTMTRPAP